MAGNATTVILWRSDLKILKVVGENFPLPMDNVSANTERRARAKTLMEMEDEDRSKLLQMTDIQMADVARFCNR